MELDGPLPGIIVLYNESSHLIKGEPHDMLAENGVITCAAAVAESLSKYYDVVRVPIRSDVEVALAPYPPSNWVIFNLGEGVEGRLFEAARIGWAIEAMGYSFTGADGNAIAKTTHKYITKSILEQGGIRTPRGWLVRDPTEANGEYPFPLIVKPVAEDASLGIGPESIVSSPRALKERIAHIVDCYRQSALVEEFIPGREFNISLWGNPPEVLPLYEIDFHEFSNPYERLVSFDAKWEPDSFAYNHTPGICPAQVNDTLGKRIREIALRSWKIMDCKGYARVDIRVDENETPYVIEVNCNPDLSPDAGFFKATRAAGYTYEAMILKIVNQELKINDDLQNNYRHELFQDSEKRALYG